MHRQPRQKDTPDRKQIDKTDSLTDKTDRQKDIPDRKTEQTRNTNRPDRKTNQKKEADRRTH